MEMPTDDLESRIKDNLARQRANFERQQALLDEIKTDNAGGGSPLSGGGLETSSRTVVTPIKSSGEQLHLRSPGAATALAPPPSSTTSIGLSAYPRRMGAVGGASGVASANSVLGDGGLQATVAQGVPALALWDRLPCIDRMRGEKVKTTAGRGVGRPLHFIDPRSSSNSPH